MGETKQIHMNLKVGSNLKSIFEKEQPKRVPRQLTTLEKIEKINKKLSELDNEILILEKKCRKLHYEKANLFNLLDEEKKNGR